MINNFKTLMFFFDGKRIFMLIECIFRRVLVQVLVLVKVVSSLTSGNNGHLVDMQRYEIGEE